MDIWMIIRLISSSVGISRVEVGIRGSEELGYWVGNLPVGCKLCFRGSKSVLFITGLCTERCFYCPISKDRALRDVVFINEVEVRNMNDILREVACSLSEGIGITGGDPLEVLDRVVNVIKYLKEIFGSKFHIHLYTSGSKLDGRSANLLENAGLDEIRIHIISRKSLEALKAVLNRSWDVVVENPVLPGQTSNIIELIKELDSIGVKYVNLNELEVSELNFQSFLIRGFKVNPDGKSVAGSKETAMEVISKIEDLGLSISVHFCPAIYKDLHQYSRRLMRRALGTKRVFEDINDGLVRWVELEGEKFNGLWVMDLAVRIHDKYLVRKSFSESKTRSGRVVEALPLTPRKVLNEFPLDTTLA